MSYQRPGDEASVLHNLGWAADSQVVHLAMDYKDTICARAILFGLHESLAKAIASMNPQVRECLLSAINHVCAEHNQLAHDSCSTKHQSLVEQAILDLVQELNKRVIFHAPKNHQ